MKLLKIFSIVSLLFSAGTLSADEMKPVEINSKAPDFELVDQDGKTKKLSDYTGKNVILVFSRAHW
ncbi:MAG: redoxin domain-containing protein [Akkermansiaceae bacterium]